MTNVSENKNSSHEVCEDCGAAVPEGRAGCLKIFEEIIAKEFGDYRYGRIHRLTVDAYSLQHPDRYMRSGKSFAAHLTGMCIALEDEGAPALNQIVQRWLSTNPGIVKPSRLPERKGNLTVAYLQAASDSDEHVSRVREWARDVWNAWSEHHALARQWIDEAAREIKRS